MNSLLFSLRVLDAASTAICKVSGKTTTQKPKKIPPPRKRKATSVFLRLSPSKKGWNPKTATPTEQHGTSAPQGDEEVCKT